MITVNITSNLPVRLNPTYFKFMIISFIEFSPKISFICINLSSNMNKLPKKNVLKSGAYSYIYDILNFQI